MEATMGDTASKEKSALKDFLQAAECSRDREKTRMREVDDKTRKEGRSENDKTPRHGDARPE